MRGFVAVSLASGACLIGCGQDQAATADGAPAVVTQPAPQTTEAQQIRWHAHGVSDALSRARDSGRQVLLYWGATWCPPCNQLRSTVFRDPAFIAMTRQFIAVYLDGDSPGAQRWGEHFGTIGYPTLIVLRPDGTEITRISSGMDLGLYPDVLATALRDSEPVGTLLKTALEAPDSISADNWRKLAFYAWEADAGRTLDEGARARTLLALARTAPAPVADRLWLQAGAALLAQDLRLQSVDAASRHELLAHLSRVLDSPRAVAENLNTLQYHGAGMVAALTPDRSSQRKALAQRLRGTMEAVYSDTQRPLRERLLTTRALIDLHRMQDSSFPSDALRDEVRKRTAWASREARTAYERQSLIYNAAWYLHEVGLTTEAIAMLESELPEALAPHYYMSYLAEFTRAQGQDDVALDWSRRAWQGAQGPATKLQWGVNHVLDRLQIRPDDVDAVDAALTDLTTQLQDTGGDIYQRTLQRLVRLDTELDTWSLGEPAKLGVLERFRTSLQAYCQDSDADCTALLPAS